MKNIENLELINLNEIDFVHIYQTIFENNIIVCNISLNKFSIICIQCLLFLKHHCTLISLKTSVLLNNFLSNSIKFAFFCFIFVDFKFISTCFKTLVYYILETKDIIMKNEFNLI